jgi:hypothetical protein
MKVTFPFKPSLQGWFSRHPCLVLGIILIACLAPFVNKAIQTDDALFVWAGQWIQKHPADFFGGTVNWWGSAIPMWSANMNPPLMSYFLAGVASLFGWNEIPLHLACLLAVFAAAAGIYALARMWCEKPLLAAVIAIFTPAFLVSGTTLMCDVLMLSFWIWALVFYERALGNESSRWQFALAGMLAGLAILTKYSAVMLLPLMAVWGVLRARKPGWWLLGLAVPMLIIACYEELTALLYGHGLLSVAGDYAHSSSFGYPGGWTARGIISLAFAGGSLLPVFFLAPWLWPWKTWITGGAVVSAAILGVFWLGHDPGLIHSWMNQSIWNNWGFRLQVAFFLLAGVHLAVLAVVECRQRWDPVSLFLLIWIVCLFIFAGVLNWTVNVRSFLPAVPAVAILTVRRLERHSEGVPLVTRFFTSLLPAVIITLGLVVADYKTANLVRTVAGQFAARYQSPGHQLWFNGHEGFQYYLERFGARPVDSQRSVLEPGDMVAVSWSAGICLPLPAGSVGMVFVMSTDSHAWWNLSGNNPYGLAGFYDADWGPVPFTIGETEQNYLVAKIYTPVRYPWEPGMAQEENAAPAPGEARQLQLAEQFEDQGKIEAAAQCYRKALAADPDSIEALNNLARILSLTGDPALHNAGESVRLAMKAATLSKWRQPLIIETLSTAFAEDNQFSNAVTMAQAANQLAILTGRPDIAVHALKLANTYSGH